MAEESNGNRALDGSEEAVRQRVRDVVDDLWNHRTTANQRKELGDAVERAGRVKPASDKAFGRL
jgi:hypothetical protein